MTATISNITSISTGSRYFFKSCTFLSLSSKAEYNYQFILIHIIKNCPIQDFHLQIHGKVFLQFWLSIKKLFYKPEFVVLSINCFPTRLPLIHVKMNPLIIPHDGFSLFSCDFCWLGSFTWVSLCSFHVSFSMSDRLHETPEKRVQKNHVKKPDLFFSHKTTGSLNM